MKKCRHCGVDVPPIFARALMDNKCPACGKEIMTGADFKEMRAFCRHLNGLNLDEKLTITIAAALSEKFDLVPKGEAKVATAAVKADVMDESAPVRVDPFAHLDAEGRIREQALLAATKEREETLAKQDAEEWGLNVPTSTLEFSKGRGNKLPPPPQEFVAMFGDLPSFDPNDIPAEAFASANNPMKQSDRMARMAKRDAALASSSQVLVSRKD